MAEPTNQRALASSPRQLTRLRREVRRQNAELNEFSARLQETRQTLDALKLQMAALLQGWRGIVRRDLADMIRSIDEGADAEAQWDRLRMRAEAASPEDARLAAASLSGPDRKVWILMEMQLPAAEIARVLNMDTRAAEQMLARIRQRLGRDRAES